MTEKSVKDQTIVVAKTDDGTVEMTFKIAWSEVSRELKKASEKLASSVTVPGFRTGKAPIDIAASHISREKLVQEVVGALLPALITKAYKENDIIPVMYPKIELLHAHDGEDWEVRAITAQFPEIKLGEYKKAVKESLENKEPKPKDQEREDVALHTLVATIEVTLPKALVEEEANSRIANLLARLEKLGLSLESYLSSQNKDVETLRAEYSKQATDALKLELILGKIAQEEKITVSDKEIESFGAALLADPKRAKAGLTEDDRTNIRTLLLKRKAIESLVK